MLRWRLILSVVFIAGLCALCWLDWRAPRPGIVLLPLAIVAAMLAAGELLAMFRKRGHEPLSWVVYAGVLLTVVAAAVPGLWPAAGSAIGGVGWVAVGLALSLILALVVEVHVYDNSRRATMNLALTAFAFVYVGVLVGFLVQLRLVGGGDGRVGMVALMSLIVTVKMSDIGQYTVGRMIGKHKLAPAVSPGKTWEGLIGGLFFGAAGAWLVLQWAGPRLLGGGMLDRGPLMDGSVVKTVGYAMLMVAAGLIGDLSESLLKRDAEVKDSSAWLPGFGGVLDLLDSLLLAGPVAYVVWAMGWMGV